MALITNTINPESAFLGGHVKKTGPFQEYPKVVYPNGWNDSKADRGGVTVQTREEEAQVMGDQFDASPTVAPYIAKVAPPAPVAPPDTGERAFLCSMLDKLGEKYDREMPIVDLRDLLQRLASAPEPAPAAKVETPVEPVAAAAPVELAADAPVEGGTKAAE